MGPMRISKKKHGKGIITNKLKLALKADELKLCTASLTTWSFKLVQKNP